MIGNLVLAVVMVGSTVVVHFVGLLGLMWLLRARGHRFRAHESAIGQGAAIVFVVLGLVAIHSIEIWLYAAVYYASGALPDFEAALYFSTTSFTTIGYGDVVLDKGWRLVGAIEGANGLLLFGWSTAFMISVINRMRALEHDWLEHDGRHR
ncbi:MAG: two pore domain potassium channel family protein [Alphaproteobacteria bacterium]|nr:two pore domain potassium channel family protein [Alphaproteobacteria bacterium]